MTSSRTGLLHGVLAYGLWGIVAAYWKLLRAIDPVELIAHRAVWGLVVFVALVFAAKQAGALRTALGDHRVLAVMALSGTLLAINWTAFVWATNTGHLLDASLGYFINPLVSVALGTIVLRERLQPLRWVAIALAVSGVALLTWRAGRLPWVSLVIALSFGLYGLVRKTANVDALVGSTIETLIMTPIAAIYLAVVASQSASVFGDGHPNTVLLVLGTGVVTAIPLVLFTSATRRLALSTIGFLQYIVPTGQFLLAVIAYGEPLGRDRLVAFGLIWIGLAVFSIDLLRVLRAQPPTAPA